MVNKETKNKSFINMWRYLQDNEVENNSFMLELFDTSLKNFIIDDLTTDNKEERSLLMEKIINECKKNIWFFFREIIKIPNKIAYFSNQTTSIKPYDYILNPTEMIIIYLYDNNISTLSELKSNTPLGIKTTIYLLEIYDNICNKDNTEISSLILSYIDNNFRDTYSLFIQTNLTVIPDYYLLDRIEKSICSTLDNTVSINITSIKCHNYFIHLLDNFDKVNLIHNLHKIKFGKENNKITGFFNKIDIDNDNIYEIIIFGSITGKITSLKNIFDYTNKIDKHKVYLI